MKKLIITAVALLMGSVVAFSQTNTPTQTTPQDGKNMSIKRNDLPTSVKTALDGKEYMGWDFEDAYHVNGSKADGTVDYYHIKMKKGTETKDIYLDNLGKKYSPEMKSEKRNDNMKKEGM